MLRPFEGLRVNARAGQHILLSHVQPLGQRFSGFLNPLTFPTMPRLLGSHFGSAGRAIETGVDSSILLVRYHASQPSNRGVSRTRGLARAAGPRTGCSVKGAVALAAEKRNSHSTASLRSERAHR